MNTVESFIARQPLSQRKVITFLRHLILDIAPAVGEKISYKIPFYAYHGSLCYLNPVSGAVDLGFARGVELSNQQQLLQRKGRKQVCSIRLYHLAEAEEHATALREILHEAAILNNHHWQIKQMSKK